MLFCCTEIANLMRAKKHKNLPFITIQCRLGSNAKISVQATKLNRVLLSRMLKSHGGFSQLFLLFSPLRVCAFVRNILIQGPLDSLRTDFPILSFTLTSKITSLFIYLKSEKSTPFLGGASPYRSLSGLSPSPRPPGIKFDLIRGCCKIINKTKMISLGTNFIALHPPLP